jgi:uncharacterized membrane protein YfcA
MMENVQERKTKDWTDMETMQVGWILISGGFIGSVYLAIRRSRNILSWLMGVGLVVVGFVLFLMERQKRIKKTGDDILAQLDELDPLARAEVVKYMADQEMERRSE